MYVYKFGGATTRSIRGLESLVSIIADTHQSESKKLRRSHTRGLPGLVVVVSAIGHTTRRLRSIAEDAEDGKALIAGETLHRILERHIDLAESLDLSDEIYIRTRAKLDKITNSVSNLVEGVTITRELSRRTLDSFLAAGEGFSSMLISALLENRGIPVVLADARKFIITNGEFGNAAPNLEEITKRANAELLPHLEQGSVILTQGFIGATMQGETTTM